MIDIPNPVRSDILNSSEKLLPLSKRKKQILCVGRLEYQKNIPELIDIWAEIEHDFPDWTLKIVGEGSERNLIENKIKNYGLKNVELTGRISDVSPFYAESQILVMTSRFEGLPLVLIEGLFFALPEISYNCPMGPDEIIEDKKNGYIIEYGNRQSFIINLRNLLESENLREKLGKNAICISAKYIPQTVLKSWIYLFKEIL